MNWKLRLQNKGTLAGILSALVVFAYAVASALGLSLPVGQQEAVDGVMAALTVLAALGVVVDPTTEGLGDSAQAMAYEAPSEGLREPYYISEAELEDEFEEGDAR